MKHRYFIRDCIGNVAGNHKGYNSMRGANIGLSRIKYKLWDRFDQLKANGTIQDNLVYSIDLEPVAN